MYQPLRDENEISLKIPWEANTIKGFFGALVIYFASVLLLPLLTMCSSLPPATINEESRAIPLDILSFGAGDGTGMSKGNLSEEGNAFKAKTPPSMLEDAKIAGRTHFNTNADDELISNNIIPQREVSTDQKDKTNIGGYDSRNVGNPDGSIFGAGLGNKGTGPGAGLGLGDIEWGGGGNRIVQNKVVPKAPPGINFTDSVRIQFTVHPDGTVSKLIPRIRGDIVLETAAMNALRQWRFNPIKENKDMIGIITFKLNLR
jgi:TonB family protein